MPVLKISLLTLVLTLVANVDNSRILGVFPHPGLSHYKFFKPIMRGLADAGHEVVVVSYFPDTKSSSKNYVDLPLTNTEEILTEIVDLEIFDESSIFDYYISFFELHKWGVDFCNISLHSSAIDEVFRRHAATPFDLIIVESFNTDCMLGVAHLLNLPVVALSSCSLMPWHYDRFALPDSPSFIPSQFVGFSEAMSFYERLVNWWIVKTVKAMYWFYSEDNKMLEHKFGKGIPDVRSLAARTSLMLVNQHFSLSGAKLLSPQVVEVGGLHIGEPVPLPEDLQRILDTASEGVVYISWGSMIRADTLPDAKRTVIVEAIRQLQQVVLWKWENETIPNQPKNLHVRRWLPQRDILCHPNVKVFMAHGGLMGLSEGAYCGVPAVITPIYGDQFLNAAAYVHRGAGVMLEYARINSTEVVLEAIRTALKPSLYQNAKILSTAYKKRPVDPLKLAIKWIEYVIENKGAKLMRSQSTQMNFVTYYSLDVLGFLLAIVLVVWKLLVCLCRFAKTKSSKIKVKKQ